MSSNSESLAPKPKAAIAGLLAGASALAAGEFVAALGSKPGPVIGVANRVVDKAPAWFVDFGKQVFGLDDKPALIIGTILIAMLLGAALGIASRKTRLPGTIGIALFGLVGFFAMSVDAQSGTGAALFIALVSVAAGVGVLHILFNAMNGPVMAGVVAKAQHEASQASGNQAAATATSATVEHQPVSPSVARRTFVGWTGGVAVASGLGALASRSLRSRTSTSVAREGVELVSADSAGDLDALIAEVNASPIAKTPSITPIVVPNSDFYRIDTALLVPQIDPADWTLTIDGMVERELTFTYDDLLERANMVEPVTLSCVSNQVGGDLVGNAVFQGVALTELLDEAGVLPGATQISSRSVDGWTCGFPTDVAYDGRTSMVAVAQNGEPLPIEHGFPARIVVSGLYGYVSATKWLDRITLTTLEDFNGYWIPRGWSKLGPVKTQSRIDTPRNGDQVSGSVPIAGVAWAPSRDIVKVEVRVDEGPWMEADLGESLGENAWRQWRLDWQSTPGEHLIQVRATDGTGETQTEVRTRPDPDGASGWHTIAIQA